jgi:hypothetical protein
MKLVISPEIISSYKRLSYSYWHALAELIDNSTYWYSLNKDLIQKADPDAQKCEIRITYDSDASILRVVDNSIGMDRQTLSDAMIIGKKTSRPGRSRYGMGLKTSCIWMGNRFVIKTKKLGETSAYQVTLDYNKIMNGEHDLEFIEFKDRPKGEHYTLVEVHELDQVLQTRRLSKIKEYIASMYREDFRAKELTITFNEEVIDWDDNGHYKFLRDAAGQLYRREFSFDIEGKRATGWVGILETGGKSLGGITILQHRRVIRGYPDAWRPEGLFGSTGEGLTTSLASQRLVGEIHLDGFSVSHTKDSIKWEGRQEELLTNELSKAFEDFKRTAAQFRKSGTKKVIEISDAEIDNALAGASEVIASPEMADQTRQISTVIHSDPAVTDNIYIPELNRIVKENAPDAEWKVDDLTIRAFLKHAHPNDMYLDYETDATGKGINISINLHHPYISAEPKPDLQQFILSCVYDALAEYHCEKRTSTLHARTIREIKNNLMKTSIKLRENAD